MISEVPSNPQLTLAFITDFRRSCDCVLDHVTIATFVVQETWVFIAPDILKCQSVFL